jgi:hypothetical protein
VRSSANDLKVGLSQAKKQIDAFETQYPIVGLFLFVCCNIVTTVTTEASLSKLRTMLMSVNATTEALMSSHNEDNKAIGSFHE